VVFINLAEIIPYSNHKKPGHHCTTVFSSSEGFTRLSLEKLARAGWLGSGQALGRHDSRGWHQPMGSMDWFAEKSSFFQGEIPEKMFPNLQG